MNNKIKIPYTDEEIEGAAEFVGLNPIKLKVALQVIEKDREFRNYKQLKVEV